MFKLIVLAVVLVVGEAIEPYANQKDHEEHHNYYTEPHYSFIYEVQDPHTHDIKSHKEERKGDHTQGAYELIEPDGTKRRVEYHVEGKSGFNVIVHREPSKHPVSVHEGEYNSAGGSSSSAGYGHESIQTSNDHIIKYFTLGVESNQQGDYQSHGSQQSQASYGGGHDDATSSIKFNTHGAHIEALTHHIIPEKHHY